MFFYCDRELRATYLHFGRKNYGDVLVSSELGKKEDRDAEETKMTMAKFLDEYKTKNMYMVHAIDRASPLASKYKVYCCSLKILLSFSNAKGLCDRDCLLKSSAE